MRLVRAHVVHRVVASTLEGCGIGTSHVRTACGMGLPVGAADELVADGAIGSTEARARECRRCYPKEEIVADYEQTALPLERKARKDAMHAARAWLAANPKAKARIVAWAREDIAEGRRASIGFYAELLRRPRFSVERGESSYKIDNRIRSCIVRLLIEEYPELGIAPYGFELRDSAWDPPAAPMTTPSLGRG